MSSDYLEPVTAMKRYGGLDVRVWTAGDATPAAGGPLVVLLHGYGAPGDDLVPLASALCSDPRVRFAFPQAPSSLSLGPPGLPGLFGDSRAWWPIDMEALHCSTLEERGRQLAQADPPELPAVRAQLLECLGELHSELGVPPGQLVLGGFSQGAMLAWDTALQSDLALAGLFCFSGTFLAEARWQPRLPGRRGLRALQAHGSDDPLLPRSLAHRLYLAAQQAGWDAEWLEFSGGHGITQPVLDAARSKLGHWLAADHPGQP